MAKIEKIKLPKKIRNSRDYNLLTEVSITLINAVADLFDTEVYEIDIISCNIRIIYAMGTSSSMEDILLKNPKLTNVKKKI